MPCLAFSLWLSVQSRWVPLCQVCRHSASLAAECHPIHQHPPERRVLLRSHRSGEAARLITSRADINFVAALRCLQPICSSHLLYGRCVTFLNSKEKILIIILQREWVSACSKIGRRFSFLALPK